MREEDGWKISTRGRELGKKRKSGRRDIESQETIGGEGGGEGGWWKGYMKGRAQEQCTSVATIYSEGSQYL